MTGRVTVSLPKQLLVRLKKKAKTDERTVSWVVKKSLEGYLRKDKA